jgi:hypothetical protein
MNAPIRDEHDLFPDDRSSRVDTHDKEQTEFNRSTCIVPVEKTGMISRVVTTYRKRYRLTETSLLAMREVQ